MASVVILSYGKSSPVFSHLIGNPCLVYWTRVILSVAWVLWHHLLSSSKPPIMCQTSCHVSVPLAGFGGKGKRRLCPCPKRAHASLQRQTFTLALQGTGRREKGGGGGLDGLQRSQDSNPAIERSVLQGRCKRKNSRHRKKEEKWAQDRKHAMFGNCK